MKKYIIAVDEGTTATRAVLYDLEKKAIVRTKSSAISQIYPQPSWVEESPAEIYAETLSVLVEMIEAAPSPESIAGIGITNQRETVVAWDRQTGKPLYNAIVWQCRRTADFMASIDKDTVDDIHSRTGLVADAYFSASKIKWLIDNVPEINQKLALGEVCFGTVDSYLIYKLTGGKSFVTDCTNASRTMLYNINTLNYDDELLEFFGVPRNSLPDVVFSDKQVGYYEYLGVKIPICGIAGDQQAALLGQCCLKVGMSKITYGTGLFMLYNTGYKPIISTKGLITTVGTAIGGEVSYAFEGSVFNAGSTIQWLRDNLGFMTSSEKSQGLAESVEDNGGVYLVPAFTGLGAPYWNGKCKGIICGLTRGTTKAHITRAGLEAMAYSAKDLADVMTSESKTQLSVIRCDGGASANDFLMGFQANILNVEIDRPIERESTALGAVLLCSLGLGLISKEDLDEYRKSERIFSPERDRQKYQEYYENWISAVNRCIYND